MVPLFFTEPPFANQDCRSVRFDIFFSFPPTRLSYLKIPPVDQQENFVFASRRNPCTRRLERFFLRAGLTLDFVDFRLPDQA